MKLLTHLPERKRITANDGSYTPNGSRTPTRNQGQYEQTLTLTCSDEACRTQKHSPASKPVGLTDTMEIFIYLFISVCSLVTSQYVLGIASFHTDVEGAFPNSIKPGERRCSLAVFPVSHEASVLLPCQQQPTGGSSDACPQ